MHASAQLVSQLGLKMMLLAVLRPVCWPKARRNPGRSCFVRNGNTGCVGRPHQLATWDGPCGQASLKGTRSYSYGPSHVAL